MLIKQTHPTTKQKNMKNLLLLLACILLFLPVFSQDFKTERKYEVSAGFGLLIYQSAYNLQNSSGLEAAVRSKIAGPADWQGGLRIGLNPILPEVFGRIILQQESGAWRPELGLELGVTGRAKFEDGDFLLRETRQAMQTGISSIYMAIHAAPLAFTIHKNWTLSALEIDFGTHFSNFGRTLRAQATLISVGRKF
jgi:hypothetical protein